MTEVVFAFARKVGDDIARIPIAYQYAKQYGCKVDIALEKESAGLISLLEVEDWVNKVFILDRPRDEFLRELGRSYAFVYNLDYFNFPYEVLTQGSINNTPINLSTIYTEPCLSLSWCSAKNLVICAESSRNYANDHVLQTITPIYSELKKLFENVYIIANDQTDEFYTNQFDCIPFRDDYKMRRTLELLSNSILLTTYSSLSVLVYIQKYPTCILIPPQGMGLQHYDRRIEYYPDHKLVNEHDCATTLAVVTEMKGRLS